MLRSGAVIGAVACGIWMVLFAATGAWLATVMDVVGITCALVTGVLERRGRLRLASGVLFVNLFALIFLSAAFLDVPTVAAPRAIHQCFLGLAACACLLMRDERGWIRHGAILACLFAYGFFAGFNPHWQTVYAATDAIRVPGAWLDLGGALVSLYVALHVLQADVADRNSLEGEIKDGVFRGEMRLFYQPQVKEDGSVVGAEALLRWQHPTRGMVLPGEFIPVAEAAGLMPLLGDWVLTTACEQLARWRDKGSLDHLRLAINVSASQFGAPGFQQRVVQALRTAGVPPGRLKMELTESTLALDLHAVSATMAALREHGIGFALDDFGTGFSSLSYLRRLPLEQLKIDQSFVRQMCSSDEDRAIVRTVVALARDLHLGLIAEGVETEEHRGVLRDMGCDLYQGYLFSRALPVADFEQFVERAGRVKPLMREDGAYVHRAQELRTQ